MPFEVPMVWREPKEHSSICYFYLTIIEEITSKSKYALNYPDLPYAMVHAPQSEELPITKPPENVTFSDEISDFNEDLGQQEEDKFDCDPTFETSFFSSSEPHLLTPGDLNDLFVILIWLKTSRNLQCQTKSVESSPPKY